MVTLRTRPVGSIGTGEGSGSGYGIGQLDDQMREFISSEIMCSIIDETPVIFDMVEEGVLEILDESLGCIPYRDGGHDWGTHDDIMGVPRLWSSRIPWG